MKIAVFHELPDGGARRAVNELSKRLKRKHTVDLFITSKKIKDEEKFFNNTYQFLFSERIWKKNDWKTRVYKDTIELWKLYNLHKKISQVIFNNNYDLLFVHASKYIESPFILKTSKTKTIFYLHDPYYRIIYEDRLFPKNLSLRNLIYEKINRWIRKLLDAQNVRSAHYIIANSYFTKKLFEKTYLKKVNKVIYLGVDCKVFKKNNCKKQFDILFIGSKNILDGYDLFNKIHKELKNKYTFRILNSEVEWISNDKEMVSQYQKSKIHLALGYNEPFGLSPLEAMACGVPVVAIKQGGYKETVIHNKTGVFVPKNPKKIVLALDKILMNQKQIRNMSILGREQVLKDWTWENAIINLEDFLQSHHYEKKNRD